MVLIYKIFRNNEYTVLLENGATRGAPIDIKDGFVHTSRAEQLQGTADKYFEGVAGLWLIAIDADSLGENLKWESSPSRGGEPFPHIYRALLTSDIVWAKELPLASNGRPVFPEGVL